MKEEMKTTNHAGIDRRSFLASTALAGLALAGGAATVPAAEPVAKAAKHNRIRLGVATYSYWHFKDPKVSVETVIDIAGELGVEGVDLLHRQMDLPEKEPLTAAHRAYLQRLKRQAFRNGVSFICLSTHQTFVSPDPAVLTANVEHTKKCIDICHELGCPCLRINTGRWNTINSFDELMRQKGVEPILPGHTEEEGFKWCIDGIERCLGKAAECGVMLALENHWGLARTPEGQLRILNSVPSPWLGALMDTGNFLFPPYKEAAYDKLQLIAPKAVYVQAKTYYGGGEWYELEIDYRRIAKILNDAGYSGYVGLEFEGKENPDIAVPKSIALLREAFGS